MIRTFPATRLALCAALIAVTGLTAVGQNQSSPGSEIRAENCMVKFIEKANVPAEVEGKLLAINVEEGASVQPGDVLAVVDDTSAQLAVQLKQSEEREAQLVALNDIELKDARNGEELAKTEAQSFDTLYKKGAVPFFEAQKKMLEAIRATLRIGLAENKLKEAQARYLAKKAEREMAEHQLRKHSIIAVFPGFVESRIAQLGEWVQPGTPIATVIQMDKLRVEGDVQFSGHLAKGMPVTVVVFTTPDHSVGRKEIKGTIDFVSNEVDLNKRYRIWVNIQNVEVDGGWLYKPGMDADLIIDTSSASR